MNKRILSMGALAIVAALILSACSAWPLAPVGYGLGSPMGNGGMMGGGGMMGNRGMMGNNGMMGGYSDNPAVPVVSPTPIGASAEPVDREVQISAANFRFIPDQVSVKPGETVRFVITNQDDALHNFVVQDAGLP